MVAKEDAIVVFTFSLGTGKLELIYTSACGAFSARPAVVLILTNYRPRKLKCELFLTDTFRTAEKQSIRNALGGNESSNGVLHGLVTYEMFEHSDASYSVYFERT